MTAARQDPDSGHHRVDYRFRHREGHCGFEDLRDLLRRIGPQG